MATMTIRIDELNDEMPHFEQALYEALVLEHATRGSVVLSVMALVRRPDTEIQYSLVGTEHFVLGDSRNVS